MGAGAASDLLKLLQDWSALALAVAAILSIVFGKSVRVALSKWRDDVLEAAFRPFTTVEADRRSLAEFRKQSVERWEAILAELRPNGGTSLKDAISRIEERQVWQWGRTDLIMHAMADAAAVYETDHTGHCVWVSPAYCRVTGRTLEECLGLGWVVVIHPDDAIRVRTEWESAVADHRPFGMHYRMVHADGHPFKVHSVASPRTIGARLLGWSGLVTVEGQA